LYNPKRENAGDEVTEKMAAAERKDVNGYFDVAERWCRRMTDLITPPLAVATSLQKGLVAALL